MRVFLNIEIHTYTIPWRSSSESDVRHTYETENIVFANNNIGIEISQRIKELTVDTSTLSKPIKIYFDTCCKYPRYKLNNNLDFKRVIKQPNSDIVIYTSTVEKLGYSDIDDKYRNFLVNDQIHSIDGKLLHRKNIHEFLAISYDIYVEELVFTNNKRVSNDVGQSLFNLFNVYTKIISDKQLDMIINNTLMNMTDEDYSSIKGMLQSKDDETFKLGLKMLVGYNTNSNAVRIGTLLMECCGDRCSMLNDVNTNQILSTLDLTKRQIQGSDTYKSYIIGLVKKSTSEDDKQFAKKFIIDNSYMLFRAQQAHIFRGFEDMDINMDINIY